MISAPVLSVKGLVVCVRVSENCALTLKHLEVHLPISRVLMIFLEHNWLEQW